jgi:hypothetical protein
VTAADNVLFSVRDDASKRPGTEHLFEITGLTADGLYHLHPIDRDATEQYLMVYGDSTIRIFTLAGVEATLTTSPDAQTYLDANNATAAEMRLVSMADYTILVNTTVTTAVESSASYTVTSEFDDFDVMSSFTPTANTYHKTRADSESGHVAGYYKYEPGDATSVGTFPTLKLPAVSDSFDTAAEYDGDTQNPGGFKLAAYRRTLSLTSVLYHPQAKILYGSACFTAYTFEAGDQLYSLTNAVLGWHHIAEKVDNDSLRMTDSIVATGATVYPVIAGVPTVFTGATWVAATSRLTATGAFTSYAWQSGDKIYPLTGGGFAGTSYTVTARISADVIEISGGPGSNGTGIACTGGVGAWLFGGTATYADAAFSLVSAAGFDGYAFSAGDQVLIASGTGVTAGWHNIASRPNDDLLILSATAGAAVATDVAITAIGRQFAVTLDMQRATMTSMHDVALQFQAALLASGCADGCVSWTYTGLSAGYFTITGPWRGSVCTFPANAIAAPDSGYNWSTSTRPFYTGGSGDVVTAGTGAPTTDTKSVLTRWTSYPAPNQAQAQFVATTMPIQITRESTGGGVEKVYNEIIVDDMPYYYWRLGEASGTVAVDEMGHCDGTYTATPTLGVAGAITGDANTAVTFNGTTESVDVQVYPVQLGPTLHSTGWSISLWFKTSDTSATSRRMISLQEAAPLILWDSDFFGVSINSQGYLGCYSRGYFDTPDEPLSQTLDSKPAYELQDGDWHHLVVTVTPATGSVRVRFYIDGALYGTDTATSAEARRTWHHIHHVYIGCDHNQIQGKFWNGTLDEVAIYERPLTAAEIAEEYAARVDVVSGGPTFNIDVIDWKPRLSGDEVTNPVPSFVGKKLSDVSFHRNRLALVGGENIVLSAAGDFFNFFIEDADNLADADPIDQAMSTDRVTLGDFMVPFRKSMVIFTLAGQQFELNAPEVLSPSTAALTASTRYDSIIGVRPAVMGTQVYFPSIAPHGAQIREYLYDDSALAAVAADITAHVEGYIPATVVSMEACPNFNTLYVLPEDGYHIYAYRAYWRGTEKVQSSWSRIVLDDADRIVDIAALRNNLYVLAQIGTKYTILRLPVERESAPTGATFMPLLDNWKLITGVYSAGTGLTTFTEGHIDPISTQVVKGGGWTTTAGVALTATRAGATTLTVVGDYSAYPCYVGRPYTMSLTLSRPYVRDREGGAVLDAGMMLHVLSLTHNESGPYTVTVAMSGYSDYSESFAPASGLTDASGETRFWIRGQADDTTVTITASGHTPCTIVCGEWESTFAPRAM